jgi:hypothetical protein
MHHFVPVRLASSHIAELLTGLSSLQADVLNINHASASSLAQRLPFLTPRQCELIEQGRKRYGAYQTWEDVERVGESIDSAAVKALRACRRPNLVLTDEPGLLDALKVLCRAEHTDARTDAVGAVNHISRSDQARPILIAHNMVHDALAPALQAKYDGEEELDAIVARATMAMANIIAHPSPLGGHQSTGVLEGMAEGGSAKCDAGSSREAHGAQQESGGGFGAGQPKSAKLGPLRRPIEEYIAICRLDGEGYMELRQAALGILVRCLQFALEGKKWVGITWGIFSVVHALRNLSENMANKRVLTSRGLVRLLGVRLLSPVYPRALHPPPPPPSPLLPRNSGIGAAPRAKVCGSGHDKPAPGPLTSRRSGHVSRCCSRCGTRASALSTTTTRKQPAATGSRCTPS